MVLLHVRRHQPQDVNFQRQICTIVTFRKWVTLHFAEGFEGVGVEELNVLEREFEM